MILEIVKECKAGVAGGGMGWGRRPWTQGLKNWFKEQSPIFHLLCQANGLATKRVQG